MKLSCEVLLESERVMDNMVRPPSGHASVFGAPDLVITDAGPEFAGQVQMLVELFGMVHEIVPEGAKWRMGLGPGGLFGQEQDLQNKGGVSPTQAVTGRSTGSLIQQISTGWIRYQCNEAMETIEALQRSVEDFHWLDARTVLRRRRALTSRPRAPTLNWRAAAKGPWYMCATLQPIGADKLGDYKIMPLGLGPGVIVCVCV